MEDMPKKEPLTEEEERLQKIIDELNKMVSDCPKFDSSVNDCLDYLSRFELKPFHFVRTFHTRIQAPGEPENGENATVALRLYSRNSKVPLTYHDYKECLDRGDVYWVILLFLMFEDTADEMKKYEAKILSGDYDFGDVGYSCACQPIYSYLAALPNDRNMPALFKYLTNPFCAKADRKKALEVYQQLFSISLFHLLL